MKKKILTLMICVTMLFACGSDSNEEMQVTQPVAVQDSIPVLRGEFIYLADAAVLKGDDFIYGVHMDSIALDLAKKIEPLKEEDFDMVPVVVRAKIIQNPKRDGWDEIIEIREVLETPVSKAESVTESIKEKN